MSVLIKAVSSIFGEGADPLNDPKLWGPFSFPIKSLSGEAVNPATSMQLSPYYACIRNISEDIGKLPLRVYQDVGLGKSRLPMNSVDQIFNREINAEMTPFTFKQTLMAHALGWGNGYAEIQRNNRGEVVALHPIHPARVTVERDDQGEIYYKVFKVPKDTNHRFAGQGEYEVLRPDEMFHITGLSGDGLVGYSVAKIAQDSLGTALATQKYGASFFGNGANHGGLLEHPGNLSQEAQDRLINSWNERHRGANNAHKVAILEEGMKWHATSVPPREAQFVEVRQFQVVDIARWFRMPPHKIQSMESATFSNIEHQSIEYVQDCLMPWLIKFEEEIKRKMLPEANIYAKFGVQSLLRGDAKSRSEYYRTQVNIGAMTPNEVRSYEDMNPMGEEADKLYMQSNMATLENISAGNPEGELIVTESVPEPNGQSTPSAKAEVVEDYGEAVARQMDPVLDLIVNKVDAKEDKALIRARAKGITEEWAIDFYNDQKAYAFEQMAGVVATFQRLTGRLGSRETSILTQKLFASVDAVYADRLGRALAGQETILPETDLRQTFYNVTGSF